MKPCGSVKPAKQKVGYSLYRGLNREQLSTVPVSQEEVQAMPMLQEAVRYKHIEASKAMIDDAARHWRWCCKRFNRPVHLLCGSLEFDKAAAAQAELFMYHELATFDIKALSVVKTKHGQWAKSTRTAGCKPRSGTTTR